MSSSNTYNRWYLQGNLCKHNAVTWKKSPALHTKRAWTNYRILLREYISVHKSYSLETWHWHLLLNISPPVLSYNNTSYNNKIFPVSPPLLCMGTTFIPFLVVPALVWILGLSPFLLRLVPTLPRILDQPLLNPVATCARLLDHSALLLRVLPTVQRIRPTRDAPRTNAYGF